MRSPRRRVLIALLALAAAAGYALCGVVRNRDQLPEGTIGANGTIEATEIDVSAKATGKIIRLAVEEGDDVRAGQVIAMLEADEVLAQVEQARGAYENARARLADLLRGSREEQIRQARANLAQANAAVVGARRLLDIAVEAESKSTELKAQLVNARTAYDSARNAYRAAQARLAEIENGTRPEQLDQARAAVEQARSQSVNAQENAARAEKLYNSGAISAQQWDAAVAQRDSAVSALQMAEARLAELQAGPRPEQRDQARAALAQAEAQMNGAKRHLAAVQELYSDRLQSKQQVEAARTQFNTATEQAAAARAQLDLLVAGPTKQSIEAAEAQVEQSRGTLDAAKATADYLTIRAPASGTVILKNLEEGELATPGAPIVRIANLDSVWVRVYTPLPNLRVRLGDRAYVETDAYPGKKYRGRVTEVADKPEFTPKNVQTREERVKLVFGVKIRLANPKHELKPGMPADAVIYVKS